MTSAVRASCHGQAFMRKYRSTCFLVRQEPHRGGQRRDHRARETRAEAASGPSMKAMIIRRHGDPNVLEPAELPVPEPGPGEALVRVGAVSVNSYLDVTNRAQGVHYPLPGFPHVLGSEHAGTLEALGPDT